MGVGADSFIRPGADHSQCADVPAVRFATRGGRHRETHTLQRPIPVPGTDGVVFVNREGHLPKQGRGYYHEYTVITPGARDRSVRRIVTGGAPLSNPIQYFYTGDHYDSFCLVTGAGRQ